ncbi:hypothetical protein [Streptomyces griseofuscus]|uniref:hypothetical protein n=1 Tax=Streptomyces griseofuscus TaxID=146922 RepID=UPI0033DAE71A
MKLPRVHCRECQRPIAAGPVAGSLSKGRLCRHDPPDRRARYGDSLVSCPGSLAIVDLPRPVEQLEFMEAGEGQELDEMPVGPLGTVALF